MFSQFLHRRTIIVKGTLAEGTFAITEHFNDIMTAFNSKIRRKAHEVKSMQSVTVVKVFSLNGLLAYLDSVKKNCYGFI